MKDRGAVFLVGAGPGDPGLLTVRAAELLAQADVVVHDGLVPIALLDRARSGAEIVYAGKKRGDGSSTLTQRAIEALLIDRARAGKLVVRLKGGDPMIFGRGSEEAEVLRAAGLHVTYVPGITSAQGAAASTGVPLTHRGLATGVRYVTGHRARDAALDLDWASLASEDTTLVVYMGAANIAEIALQLMRHGMPAPLPVLAISAATTPREARILSTLGQIGTDVAMARPEAPVLFIIGHVAGMYPAIVAADAMLSEGAGMAAYA